MLNPLKIPLPVTELDNLNIDGKTGIEEFGIGGFSIESFGERKKAP